MRLCGLRRQSWKNDWNNEKICHFTAGNFDYFFRLNCKWEMRLVNCINWKWCFWGIFSTKMISAVQGPRRPFDVSRITELSSELDQQSSCVYAPLHLASGLLSSSVAVISDFEATLISVGPLNAVAQSLQSAWSQWNGERRTIATTTTKQRYVETWEGRTREREKRWTANWAKMYSYLLWGRLFVINLGGLQQPFCGRKHEKATRIIKGVQQQQQ